jgi:hypothetical protein
MLVIILNELVYFAPSATQHVYWQTALRILSVFKFIFECVCKFDVELIHALLGVIFDENCKVIKKGGTI